MKLRLLLAALVVSLPASLLVAPAAQAATPALQVTWPEHTRFNPLTTDYTIAIEVDPDAELTVRSRNVHGYYSAYHSLPPSGLLTIDFPADGIWEIAISACRGSDCVHTSSPTLRVQRDLDVQVDHGSLVAGPQRDFRIGVGVGEMSYEGRLQVAWSLAPEEQPDDVVASGVADLPQTYDLLNVPGLRLPEGSGDGRYLLDLRLSMQTADFGLLEGSYSTVARWDSTAPTPVGFTLSGSVVYPALDGYLDTITASFDRKPGADMVTMIVTNEAGGEVERSRPGKLLRGFTFGGRDSRRRPLPPGPYSIELVTVDQAGNSSSVSRQVTLRPEVLTWTTTSTTFPATKLLVDTFAGSCSSLVRSPKGRPRGAVGLYSDQACRQPRESTVAAVFGARLAGSYKGRYRSFRVSVDGGAARRAKGSTAELSYYVRSRDKYDYRTTLRSKQGRQRGPAVDNVAALVVDPIDNPSLYWSIATGGGNRFDVSTITVEVERQVLALPSSSRSMSRTASEANTIAEPSGAPGPG